jgi:LPXTG-site transpeptidase (sortase) family protein
VFDSRAGDRVGGLSKRIFVLILAMVIAGFAIPSPGVGTPGPGFKEHSQYHPLARPATPEQLIVPSIDLRAPVLPIEVHSNGTLYPPSDYHEVGWWTGSAKPGATSGQTLITGHTVHTGGGVMDRLGGLRPGDLIKVRTKIGTVEYLATKIFVYTKAQLAKHRQDLFGQDRKDYRLVLVTCTGWTGTEYTSNIIVFASELGVHNAPGDKSDSNSTFQQASAGR